jgi:hypothetical protein
MPAAAREIPVNPNKPAISATMKNPSAQRSIFNLLWSSCSVVESAQCRNRAVDSGLRPARWPTILGKVSQEGGARLHTGYTLPSDKPSCSRSFNENGEGFPIMP